MNAQMIDKFYLVGSGLNAHEVLNLPQQPGALYGALNNSIFLDFEFDYFFHPYDFKPSRGFTGTRFRTEIIPAKACNDQEISTFGPKAFRGATTMIAVSYWLIKVLRPKQITYIGCDMNYTPDKKGKTHFYGVGNPDPLRPHISLGNLGAKLKRLWYFADQNNVQLCRHPSQSFSRLPFLQSDRGYSAHFDLQSVDQAILAEKSALPDVIGDDFARIERSVKLTAALNKIDQHWDSSINPL
jgi:hypothetical protein